MSSVSELDFFILLCAEGSISNAAKALDISSAAASKRLAQIEKNMGCQLVIRSTRAMSLTSSGQLYLEYAQKISREMDTMRRAIRQQSTGAEGTIRINAPFGFGRKYIADAISQFVREYPQIDCQLYLTDHPVNLIERSFDVCIRFGNLPDSTLHARKLVTHQRWLCAAPRYLKKAGTPAHPRELSHHNCLFLRQNDDTYGNWTFIKENEHHHVKVAGSLSANDGETVLHWTLQGLGVTVRAEWDVVKHVKTGKLIRLLPDYALPNADIYAVYPYSQYTPIRVRLLIDFLAEYLRQPLIF
ncbi:MAG TPA: LysR family transcriptional regulator [Halomonas sp.]|jgi:DNA-binding transcriptional LysR family regulator|uniref:LysR family transcriptional regulator n=1 Tax=Vreelandella aquamarina TaxID=77097 RepID=A0A6F8STV7_9GAMM|nr:MULTISPECIES: LysR substrate-binding domain-containing protein [Halomonas]MEC9020692.1 LysR substrate-binding domain-containing protein [Pseudomonadota bacterium]HAO00337.1 LysR family transcriptional regulator [Halomonas sp.]MEC9294715.1 LysR substrate-binding domain-containing protein [Pseudomonadota bacterium]MED5556743.1 LysR substrate-binding domain-containing protein [Pseudomonadota bacterium]MEE3269014.1 LysR substrate-binding domain-containing protein [Pseudomonadota bacterium]|tara:strand:- start:1687 stop:2586 length:900 start_codon:yes stop_codon:yes gene_type:complete